LASKPGLVRYVIETSEDDGKQWEICASFIANCTGDEKQPTEAEFKAADTVFTILSCTLDLEELLLPHDVCMCCDDEGELANTVLKAPGISRDHLHKKNENIIYDVLLLYQKNQTKLKALC